MKTRKGHTTGGCLPYELTELILSRFSVKTLIRFRLVCKAWHSLISNPLFINLHLLGPSRAAPHDPIRFRNAMHMPEPHELKTFFIRDKSWAIPDNDDDLERDSCMLHILGCQNGIFCVHVTRTANVWLRTSRLPRTSVYLWNPALRIVKHYPSADIFRGDYRGPTICLGFVSDEGLISNDYKLLRVMETYMCPTRVEAEVYSFGNDSWKEIKGSPTKYIDHDQKRYGPSFAVSVYVNEALHWLGSGRVHSFNMRDEVFRDFAMPKEFLDTKHTFHATGVFAYKGLLALLGLREIQHPRATYTGVLWVMKEYGVTDSWTKLNIRTKAKPPVSTVSAVIDYFTNLGNLVVTCSDNNGGGENSLTLERWSLYRESLVLLDKGQPLM